MDKDQLKKFLQSWCKNDSEIAELQKQIKIRKVEKKNMNIRLLEIMKKNEIERIDLHGEGTLVFKQQKIKKNLTKKNILALLDTYFQGDSEKIQDIDKFLCDNIETNIKDVIVRNRK
jgi:Family of unknown function (DUF5760)